MSVSLYRVDYKKISNLDSADISFLEKHFDRNPHGTFTIGKEMFVGVVEAKLSAPELAQFGDLLKSIKSELDKDIAGIIDIGIY